MFLYCFFFCRVVHIDTHDMTHERMRRGPSNSIVALQKTPVNNDECAQPGKPASVCCSVHRQILRGVRRLCVCFVCLCMP